MDQESSNSNAKRELHYRGPALDEAIREGQFFLVYQPTIDLQTNAFAGVEALLRWRHPELGVLSPDTFIDELESSGQIVPVGRWTLQTACAQGAAWHDRGYRFSVSVNVSQQQFESSTFFDDVADALFSSRFDPSLLVLEFAQATLMVDRGASGSRLTKLRTLGVRFAVDDFEPGDSALDELEEFPIDIVKLDREFIAGLASSSDASTLVHRLVESSETRHLQVIAAGVEDSEQRAQLQNEKVHVGQGYLFSRPHEAEEIDRFLEDFAIFSGKPL
ncbi:MAG TPA: EAL domain-containing protein [Acidimicrobiales bacterium]|jgi:EAL domain-containing protein (putative c-di-GMP-specific phosphodiesterase class I)|nr:EAL domain-containing protein [Acidimicrobiales bacterium]